METKDAKYFRVDEEVVKKYNDLALKVNDWGFDMMFAEMEWAPGNMIRLRWEDFGGDESHKYLTIDEALLEIKKLEFYLVPKV